MQSESKQTRSKTETRQKKKILIPISHSIEVFDEYLDDDVTELDVHDVCNGLFLRPQQGRTKANAQVAYRHQVLIAFVGNPEKNGQELLIENCFKEIVIRI